MRRAIPIILLVLAVAAAAFVWQRRPAAPEEGWLGYVEGETLRVAAPVAGTLARLDVERGASVPQGAPLFALNPVSSDADIRRLEAEVSRARAQREDLRKQQRRPLELQTFEAQQRAAAAELQRARKELERVSALVKDGYATRARLDSARAAVDVAQANVDSAKAQQRAGAMTGREDQLRAADAAVRAAEAALAAQRRRSDEIAPVAPAAAQVEQTYYRPGEWVAANAPVVSLLPPGLIKLRFYVPEPEIASLAMGTVVEARCDGCAAPIRATVNYIAPSAEFTPPVIYSERARAKQVFLVEAKLQPGTQRLPLGLPVDVRKAGAP